MIIAAKKYSLKRYQKYVLPLIALLAVTEGASIACGASFSELRTGILRGIAIFAYMFPPDWSASRDMIEPAIESVIIALLGTVFGTLMSIIFAVLAASNLSYGWVRNVTRFFIGLERSVPEIVILLLLIAAFGLGAPAAIIVLSLGCIGMMGKLLADVIEEIDHKLIESIESVGANKLQVIVFGVIPQIMPNLISYALFRFEINIRLSVLLGAVGAGGIGYILDYSFGMLQYHTACTAMLIVMAIIFGTEQLSQMLRKRFKVEGALK